MKIFLVLFFIFSISLEAFAAAPIEYRDNQPDNINKWNIDKRFPKSEGVLKAHISTYLRAHLSDGLSKYKIPSNIGESIQIPFNIPNDTAWRYGPTQQFGTSQFVNRTFWVGMRNNFQSIKFDELRFDLNSITLKTETDIKVTDYEISLDSPYLYYSKDKNEGIIITIKRVDNKQSINKVKLSFDDSYFKGSGYFQGPWGFWDGTSAYRLFEPGQWDDVTYGNEYSQEEFRSNTPIYFYRTKPEGQLNSFFVELAVAFTDISNYSVSLENQVYSGFDQTPSITLKSPTGTLLTKSVDYELVFSNNLNVGTANITIKGIGTYAGEINKTFEITPATPTIEKLPSTTELMANSTLSESVISTGVVNGVGNDGKLAGQFKWKTPNHVVTESGEYASVFTPTGASEANYKPIETQVFVNVTKLSNVIPPVNIDHSSPPIDLENTNSDRGTGLSIRYVSGLDFGQNELSFSEQKIGAKEDQAVNKETGTSETFENMITVEDGRGIRNGWVLTVRQYSEFNDGTVLEMNPNVDGRNIQGVFTGSNKLVLNGLSQIVAWSKNSESQMAGISSIGFGEVTLTIPKGGGVGEKQNSLIWELTDGPVPP